MIEEGLPFFNIPSHRKAYPGSMLIGSKSAIRSTKRLADQPTSPQPSEAPSIQTPADSDSVERGREDFGPLGVGRFSGKGLMGKLMKWTSRELPSSQTPISEEEKQAILDKLQPGDIVLTYASHRPNLGHLEYLTTGSHYTHCALYEGYGRIIETLGDQVMRSPLVDRMEGPVKIAVVRPPYKNFKDRGDVIKEAKKLIGRPYDYKFDNNDEKELYCSELIEVAMKKVDPDLDVPDARFLGREITAPDAFQDMKGARLIHDGHSNYWANQRHQWPFLLGAAVGAGVGTTLFGPLGGVIGAAVGFEGTLAATKLLKA
jgi:Permuted papain-like amidase enzyme, YaeF/YiiX, C92 family